MRLRSASRGSAGSFNILSPSLLLFQRTWPRKDIFSPSVVGLCIRTEQSHRLGVNQRVFPNLAIGAVRQSAVPLNARVLDVGCGSGRALLDLSYLGFSNLSGVDPFVEKDLFYANGVKVFRRDLASMSGEFDLITFHYSFEHMDQPEMVLRETKRLLSPSGMVIIRIPVACSYAWRHYGVNWFNLDPPRHLYIHTFRSMDLLAQRVGLKVINTIQESGAGQFWTSEEYEHDIPHNDPRTLGSSSLKRLLKWKKIRSWSALKRKSLTARERGSGRILSVSRLIQWYAGSGSLGFISGLLLRICGPAEQLRLPAAVAAALESAGDLRRAGPRESRRTGSRKSYA